MRTVPVAVAASLLADRPDLRALLSEHGRQVGRRVEVDLDAVAAAGHRPLAQALLLYGRECDELWRALEASTAGGRPFVTVRRDLLEHVQLTGKKDRADLGEVYEAFATVPTLADLVERLTGAEPDVAALTLMASSLGGQLSVPADGVLEVTLRLSGRWALPDVLGGVSGPGEVSRELVLTARQAAWRDRRVRRLARVLVRSVELWPDPAPSQAGLPAAA
jgi:hypothetical protein